MLPTFETGQLVIVNKPSCTVLASEPNRAAGVLYSTLMLQTSSRYDITTVRYDTLKILKVGRENTNSIVGPSREPGLDNCDHVSANNDNIMEN